MFWKLSVGVVFAFLIGCGDYGTEILSPDTESPDSMLGPHVGETHRLEAYYERQGGMTDSQSFDCDDPKASSSDPSIVDIEISRSIEIDTMTADEVTAAVALYHAIAPGTAVLTLTCNDHSTAFSITVLP